MKELKNMMSVFKQILSELNLFVNESKTEFAHVRLADPKELTSGSYSCQTM